MKRLTIFTPTYNRAYILPKLYESLCAQTCQDFEWLIIDDGSTDNTKELIEGWVKEQRIVIRYFYQENSGKMMAHNKAVEMSESELFMCIDSDDRLCTGDVIADCLAFWDQQHGIRERNIAGFIAYKRMQDKSHTGEKTLFFLREVLAKYPFPHFEGEKFVTDVYVYDQIESVYQMLQFPYYVQECKYNEDGYSHNYMKLLFDNPIGFRAYHNQCVRLKKKGYVKSGICYVALSLRVGGKGMLSETANLPLTLLLFPLGVLKYFYDQYRLSRI